MNTIIPQAWIIDEQLRIERERRRKESEGDSLPITLPNSVDDERDLLNPPTPEAESPKGGVIIIDI